MSARAIRALRGDNDALLRAGEDSSEGSLSDDEHETIQNNTRPKFASFAAMHDDSDDDEESSTSEEEVHHKEKKLEETKDDPEESNTSAEEEEDIDALIDEYRAQDDNDKSQQLSSQQSSQNNDGEKPSFYGQFLKGIDVRDLDVDASTRNALVGGDAADAVSRRATRQTFLFGPPRDGWIKPPHFVGGGIGMAIYELMDSAPGIPWPYSEHTLLKRILNTDEDAVFSSQGRWYTFKHSDTSLRDSEDYKVIQQSGDLNALVMFVAHHPYAPEALLQLSTVLYQTNHTQEGLAFLRRCLWVYESSALMSFTKALDGTAMIDAKSEVNQTYFKALFKLIQVSAIAGLPRTATALCRYTLSLDPLRDPMCVLMVLDSFALASNSSSLDCWLIEVVESGTVPVLYRSEDDTSKIHHCRLTDMPNWCYSYALALFRRYETTRNEEQLKSSNEALLRALRIYPFVPGQILQCLDVDTTGRSFRRDWVSVLDHATHRTKWLAREWSRTAPAADTVELAASTQACDVISRVYVQRGAQLWKDDAVLQWLYDGLVKLKSEDCDRLPQHPSPALARYLGTNTSDFEGRIQLLPQDVNIIDPGMVAHALVVNPNRPRFLRNMQRNNAEWERNGPGAEGQFARGGIAGPPNQVVDPDWPLLEVFWRSFLPWNRVEGVPPPRRF